MNQIYGTSAQQLAAASQAQLCAQLNQQALAGTTPPAAPNSVLNLLTLVHNDVDSLFKAIDGLEATIGGVLAIAVPTDGAGVGEQTGDSDAVKKLRELRMRIQFAQHAIDAIAQRAQV